MRDPSTSVFQYWTNVINSGKMIGQNRPVGRCTISKNSIDAFPTSRGTWRSYRKQTAFANLDTRVNWPEKEFHGIETIQIDRGLDNSAATCEIRIWNNDMFLPEYQDFGVGNPGYKTPTRGQPIKDYTSEYTVVKKNEWYDLFRPNRIIHTYQGYGTDDTTGFDPHNPDYIPPWNDSRLLRTGVWVIDKVTMHAPNGDMVITCRDAAKFLIEQYAFPPLIDTGRWPLDYRPVSVVSPAQAAADGHNVAKWDGSSTFTTDVHLNLAYWGHYPSQALDGNSGTAWLSAAHFRARDDGTHHDPFEWIQFNCSGNNINFIKVTPWAINGTGYVMYISVKSGGTWLGSGTIPYTTADGLLDNGAHIPYVGKVNVKANQENVIPLGNTYQADIVRVTFTSLDDFHQVIGAGGAKYACGVREFFAGWYDPRIKGHPDITNAGSPGIISDYSEIIREACAWGGFFDPGLPLDPLMGYSYNNNPQGGIWGDIENMNSAPITPIGYDKFTSKSMMDIITFVAQIHGAIFFIDDEGGAIFRLPNVWAIGNYITDPQSTSGRARIANCPIVFDERKNLITIETILSDDSLRSDYLVIGSGGTDADGSPVKGGYTPGFNSTDPSESSFINDKALLAGQTRVTVVSNEPVTTDLEAARMAELLAMQSHFQYRTSTITAPCHPGLQLDDQVKVFERITNDSYVHYVQGISSTMDLTSGEYTMQVTTIWLGDDPTKTWVLNDQSNSEIVKYYTDALAQWQAVQNKQSGV